MDALISLRWQDLVDIVLTSYILLRLYILFRATAVFRVIAAVAGLWVFQRISAAAGLIVTSWLMQGFIAFAALIIIIIFKDEIRRVLEVKNLRSVFWGAPRKSLHSPLEIISETVFDLARQRTGALLVFPGKESLEGLIQSGISWNGTVSKEMLMSIFWQDNPVHDGAAVIHGERIRNVSAILPLTRQDDLPSRYGTRHRAALGLAEASDALTVVISEERGEVSVARDGRLRRMDSREQLRLFLAQHLGVTPEHHTAPSREGMRTVAAGLFSLVLVTGVWLSFSQGQETFISLEPPLTYVNRDPSLIIYDISDSSVKVRLRGSGPIVRRLDKDRIKVRLDLSDATLGRNSYTLTAENVLLPPGISLDNLTPSIVSVGLDVTMTKRLPVQVDWVGRLPEQMLIPSAAVEPATVNVVGAQRYLQGLQTLYTEKLPVQKVEGDKPMEVDLVLPPSLKLASGARPTVKITCSTDKRLYTKAEGEP